MRMFRTMAGLIGIITILLMPAIALCQTERRADVPSSMLYETWPEWKQRHEALIERAKQNLKAGMIFIGDSITQGWESGGATVWEKYYARRNALNLGISGDQVQYCMWRLDHGELDGLKPKLAVVMMGTNNCWGDEFPASQTIDGIKLLIKQLRTKLPKTKILLLAIFPREDIPEPMRAKPIEINKAISKLHDGRNVYFLDIGAKFLNEKGHISNDIMGDLLHPTTKGYQIWAESIEPMVSRLMGDKRVN